MVIPVCSRATATVARTNPAACELIHPSPDRRDWRRWLKGSGHDLEVDITRGQVFDMLEQGIAAAIAGHGISIGDLALCATAIDEAARAAVQDRRQYGDAYYLVWPDDSAKAAQVRELLAFLESRLPRLTFPGIRFNGPG